MGGRGGASGAGGGGGSGGGRITGNAFVTDNRGRVLVSEQNGVYQYHGGFNNGSYAVDTSSAEYKRALSWFNVKYGFNSDGSVTVSRGGLYERKRTFKTTDAFQKETNKRLDEFATHYDRQASRTKSGRISQIEAENFKSSMKRHVTSDAMREMGSYLRNSIHTSETYAQAARDMKARLTKAMDERRRR